MSKSQQKLSIVVDSQDSDLLSIKIGPSSGYARTTIRPQKYIHCMIAERMGLSWNRKTEVIDHINRDKLDNRRENLRVVSKSENSVNSPRCDKAKGYRKVGNVWIVRVRRYGKIHRKSFNNEKDAWFWAQLLKDIK
jgi:hypothetical protein